MGFTHIGDQAAVGLGDLAQLRDLSQTAHAHFHHRDIRIRLNGQQGFRQTNFIVKIALGFDDLVFRA